MTGLYIILGYIAFALALLTCLCIQETRPNNSYTNGIVRTSIKEKERKNNGN